MVWRNDKEEGTFYTKIFKFREGDESQINKKRKVNIVKKLIFYIRKKE